MTRLDSRPTPSSLLRTNRRFAALWTAQTVSQLGDRVGGLALPLIAVTVLHATATEVGLLSAALWIPYLGPLWVSRWIDGQRHKRRILVGADLVRIVVLATVPAALLAGVLTLRDLYAVAFLLGIGEVFFKTAPPSVFVELVDREDDVAGSSALSAGRSASYLAGPALGGWLVQVVSAPLALLTDALSFADSALFLGCPPLREAPSEPRREGVGRRALVGLRFVPDDRYLRTMLGCSTTFNFFSFVGAALLVLLARRTLGLPAAVIGLAFGVGAAGSLLGAVGASRLGRSWGSGRVALAGAVVSSAAVALPAVRRRLFAPPGRHPDGGRECRRDRRDALRRQLQRHQDGGHPRSPAQPGHRCYSMVNYGIRPLGAIVGGLLGSAIGIRTTLGLAGAGAGLSVLWLVGSPLLGVPTSSQEIPSQRRESTCQTKSRMRLQNCSA